MIHNKRAYVDRFAEVYTNSRWVAAAAYDLGPPEAKDLPEIMRKIVEDVEKPAQLTLLAGYPDLAGLPLGQALDQVHLIAAKRFAALFET